MQRARNMLSYLQPINCKNLNAILNSYVTLGKSKGGIDDDTKSYAKTF
jgi:hypothetical protein